MDLLLRIVKHNSYIRKFTPNSKKDINSLSYLIKTDCTLSQSDCIKIGIAIEKVLVDVICSYNTGFVNIKSKNIKNKHERDHLFINEDTKTLVYSELKSNLNLDTEKSKTTVAKCLHVVSELKKEYPDYNIKWCLLGLRYNTRCNIPNKILYKYYEIEHNVYGINDYFKIFDISIKFTDEEYSDFLNMIVKAMFKKI